MGKTREKGNNGEIQVETLVNNGENWWKMVINWVEKQGKTGENGENIENR